MANKWVAKVLAKTVLSQESQENNDNPLQTEVKDDLGTTPVASSADVAIEIAQLKQDQEDQVLISSLEEDIAEVEAIEEGLDDVIVAHDEIGEYKEAMESFIEDGGMSKQTATMVRLGLQQSANRIYMNYEHGALESFDGSLQATVLAMEEADGMLAKAWNAIKEFFKGIYNRVVGWFKKSTEADKKNIKDVETKILQLKEAVKANPDVAKESVVNTPSSAATQPEESAPEAPKGGWETYPEEVRKKLGEFGFIGGKGYIQYQDEQVKIDTATTSASVIHMTTVLFGRISAKTREIAKTIAERSAQDRQVSKITHSLSDLLNSDGYKNEVANGVTVASPKSPLFGGIALRFTYADLNNEKLDVPFTAEAGTFVMEEPATGQYDVERAIKFFEEIKGFTEESVEFKKHSEETIELISKWLDSKESSEVDKDFDLEYTRYMIKAVSALLGSGAMLKAQVAFTKATRYCLAHIHAPK